MGQQTVTINGVRYDAQTGMRIERTGAAAQTHHAAGVAQSIHAAAQRSQTLNRKFVKKQIAVTAKPTHHPQNIVRTEAPKAASLHRKQIRLQPSPHTISKFAAEPTVKKPVAEPKMRDIAPQPHPLVHRAHSEIHHRQAMQKAAKHPVHASAHAVKQHVVSETLAAAPSHHANTKPVKQKSSVRKMPRIVSVVSASAALLLLAGYFTYINMPNLSVRVAAAQAGINATYPGYRPDGYSLSGPIAYNSGQVSMKFAYNSGAQNFTVTQSRSNWDSSAVEQNYAEAKWGNDVATTVDHGLTIYTHDSNAAWVNGGILYTISGNAPLSSQQVLNIATSM